jgi:tRNA dimethylallyltransferase
MYTRINQRVDIMMQHGLLTAKGLYANKELNALQTVGYRELFSYLKGNSANLLSKKSKNTRRFAKQITWFKEINYKMVRF